VTYSETVWTYLTLTVAEHSYTVLYLFVCNNSAEESSKGKKRKNTHNQ